MYPRTNYEMTEADLRKILDACKPVPMIMLHIGGGPRSQQDRANDAWAELGARMGFDSMTVLPIEGKSSRFFTAVPNETEDQRGKRESKEAEEKREREISSLSLEIESKRSRLESLMAERQTMPGL